MTKERKNTASEASGKGARKLDAHKTKVHKAKKTQKKGKKSASAKKAAAQSKVLSNVYYLARRDELAERVGPRRFEHSLGVAYTAVILAQAYGVNRDKARLAGLLHDWDKGLDDSGILDRVKELGMEVSPELLEMPRVLHGMTAAQGLARDYPEIPADVLQAIARHTVAAPDMTDLDMVIYIADALEPSREGDQVDYLRSLVGDLSLRELFLEVYAHWVSQMLARRQRIYSRTVEFWNSFMPEPKPYKCKGVSDAMPGKGCKSSK